MSMAEPNIHLLRQALALLDSLDDATFRTTGGIGGAKAGIGPHLRHCIDFYEAFLEGAASGRIDYDARHRDPAVERERTRAVAAIERIVAGLSALDTDDTTRLLEVRADAAAWGDPAHAWNRSSLGRELCFLLSHTVHHYALIATLLRSRGIEPDADFGVAPSTLAHQAVAACSS